MILNCQQASTRTPDLIDREHVYRRVPVPVLKPRTSCASCRSIAELPDRVLPVAVCRLVRDTLYCSSTCADQKHAKVTPYILTLFIYPLADQYHHAEERLHYSYFSRIDAVYTNFHTNDRGDIYQYRKLCIYAHRVQRVKGLSQVLTFIDLCYYNKSNIKTTKSSNFPSFFKFLVVLVLEHYENRQTSLRRPSQQHRSTPAIAAVCLVSDNPTIC